MKTKFKKSFQSLSLGLFVTMSPSLMASNDISMKDEIFKEAYSHLSARAIHTACYYKLFDELGDKPKSVEAIAKPLNLKEQPVKRLLAVLANHKYVQMDENDNFTIAEKAKLLVSTAIGSFCSALAKEHDHRRWASIGHLDIALESDVTPFDVLYNQSFYEYVESDQKAGQLFNQGMKNFSEKEDPEVANSFNFSDFTKYCDIGGGTGGLVSQVMSKHTNLKGILFDLEDAVKLCPLTNVEKVAGSFFEAVPSADIYTVKRVLHNWKDEECIKILKNVVSSIANPKDGRILVIEKIMSRKFDGGMLADADMISMALGGIERTLGEFTKLAKAAGLELDEVVGLSSGVSMMIFKKQD